MKTEAALNMLVVQTAYLKDKNPKGNVFKI
jgi:hypothetical protein